MILSSSCITKLIKREKKGREGGRENIHSSSGGGGGGGAGANPFFMYKNLIVAGVFQLSRVVHIKPNEDMATFMGDSSSLLLSCIPKRDMSSPSDPPSESSPLTCSPESSSSSLMTVSRCLDVVVIIIAVRFGCNLLLFECRWN